MKKILALLACMMLGFTAFANDTNVEDDSLSSRMTTMVENALEGVSVPFVDWWILAIIAAVGLLVCVIVSKNHDGERPVLTLSSLTIASLAVLYLLLEMGDPRMAEIEGFWGFVGLVAALGAGAYGFALSIIGAFGNLNMATYVCVNWLWGFVGWLLCPVVLILSGLFEWDIEGITLLVGGAYQLIFCLYVAIMYIKEGEGLIALPVILVYLISCLAGAIVIISFVVSVIIIALIIIIGLVVLSIMASGGSSSDYNYRTSDGDRLRKVGYNEYRDEYGNTWREDSSGRVYKE